MVNSIYLKRAVSNIFYVTLIDTLESTNYSLNSSKSIYILYYLFYLYYFIYIILLIIGDLMILIEFLIDNFNHWIKLIPNKSG